MKTNLITMFAAACLIAVADGCVLPIGDEFTLQEKENAPAASDGINVTPVHRSKIEKNIQIAFTDEPHPVPLPASADEQDDVESELPNAIEFATCESDPDEIAVPLNALPKRFCDTLQAFAYRADENGAYEVSANYFWSIADESVARIVPLPGQEQDNVQRPSVSYDILHTDDQLAEPSTTVTVCAVPRIGWPVGEEQELCRNLPLYSVVNIDGAWCFSGATFADGDCTALRIEQDGRFLTVDASGQGTIYGKYVDFYKGDYFYEADLTSHDEMSGHVIDAYTKEELGAWQAWKLPLP